VAFDFEHTVGILNTDFRCAGFRTDAHLSVNHANAYTQWTLMLLSDLTKLAVAVADVDRFC